MCTQGKCCCLTLETGTLTFGVISSVLNALSILGVIGGLIAFNIIAAQPHSINYGYEEVRFRMEYAPSRVPPATIVGANIGLVFALIKAVMDFTFAVLLCTGVTKRKPSNIKAYFIYGIVMAVLNSIAVLVLTLVSGALIILLFGIIGLVLYGLILHMINLTQQKMTSGQVYGFEHKPLQETIY